MSLFGSEIIGMGKSAAARFLYACMSLIQLWCESMESQDRAMHLMLRLAKSGTSDANTPSSVVHTGEKSAGYEIRMPHLYDIKIMSYSMNYSKQPIEYNISTQLY